jgi:phage pi2 protein 07
MFNPGVKDNVKYVQRNFCTIDPENIGADELKSLFVRTCQMYTYKQLAEMFDVEPIGVEFTDSLSWGIDILSRYTVEEIVTKITDYERKIDVLLGDFAYFVTKDGEKHRGMVTGKEERSDDMYYEIFDGRKLFTDIPKSDIRMISGHSQDYDIWLMGEMPVDSMKNTHIKEED